MKNWIGFVVLGLLLIVSCKKSGENTEVITEQIQELLYKDVIAKWNVVNSDLNLNTQKQIESWNEFRLLHSELAQKPEESLGAIQQKSEIIAQQIDKVIESIPTGFQSKDLISRLRVLSSKAQMLDTQTHQDYLSAERIIKYNTELVVDFELVERQLERLVLKKTLRLEEELPLLYE